MVKFLFNIEKLISEVAIFTVLVSTSFRRFFSSLQSLPYKVKNLKIWYMVYSLYSIHFRMMKIGTFWQKKWNNF